MAFEFISEIVLPRLLATSVQSALFVTVVWAVCRALPRLSASARCGLWWLVALQLVVGLLWSSPLALPLLPADVVQQSAPVVMQAAATLPVAAATTVASTPDFAPAAASSVLPTLSWSLALAVLWLLGLSIMLTRTLRGYLATRQLLRHSQRCRDRTLLHALQLAAEAHGLQHTPHLRLSSAIDSPQLIGPWRPVLLLPENHSQAMHADELDMALTHELVHLQRRDLWWGLLPAVAQHLFFFNPFAHYAAREYALAREAACDAAVIAGNRHCAHDYGRLLVRLGVAPRPSAGLASASPTFRILKRRLIMLQNTASTPRVVALVVLGIAAVLGVMPYRITAANAGTAPVAPATPLTPSVVALHAPLAMQAAVNAPVAALAAPVAISAPLAVPVDVSVPVAALVTAPVAVNVDVPVPPAPPTLRNTPAPPSPPSSPNAPAAPAPPAPPSPGALRGVFTLGNTPPASAFVLMSNDDSVANASTGDLKEARTTRRGNEELLWLRKGNARYVVRDAATLARFRAAYAETVRLGEAQGELGDRQGRLGEQQGALGEQQGELGMQMAELATQAATKALGGKPSSNSEKMAALQAKQHSLAEQMQPLAQRQQALGREQAALGAKQAAASERASRESNRLIEEAIKSGIARPLKQ